MARLVAELPPTTTMHHILMLAKKKGQSQFLSTPAVAKPLDFGSLSLNDEEYGEDVTKAPKDSDARLMEMLAAQAAAHQAGQGVEDENAIAEDAKLSDDEKKDTLQKALNMAASNGDVAKVRSLLEGKSKEYIDVNMADEDGTPPLIYASCFVCSSPKPLMIILNFFLPKYRATKALSKHSSTRASTSTNKIKTNGVH